MKMNIYISIGELIDKVSILEIKKKKILDKNKKKNINFELKYLKKKLKIIKNNKKWINKIKKVNLKLWDIENKIRIKENEKKFDKIFIKLAREVYITNDLRYKIKKEINLFYNSAFQEEKSY